MSGNKYLGIIDSKPLIHFSASGDTGWKPLSYESDVTDNSINVTEKALFRGLDSEILIRTVGIRNHSTLKNMVYIQEITLMMYIIML